MREGYRLQKNTLQNQLAEQNKHLSVFILYTGKEIPDYDLVYEKMGVVINRLAKFLHEKNQPHT